MVFSGYVFVVNKSSVHIASIYFSIGWQFSAGKKDVFSIKRHFSAEKGKLALDGIFMPRGDKQGNTFVV
jgi:hypothetical protein